MSATRNLSPSEFVCSIRRCSWAGDSFIPLVGSGLSSASGILTGQQLIDYLSFVTYRVVARHTWQRGNPWNLRSSGWPVEPSETELALARSWIREQFDMLCRARGFRATPDRKTDVYVQSIGPAPSSKKTLTPPAIPSVLRKPGHDIIVSGLLTTSSDDRQQIPSVYSQHGIRERAILALSDWRSALEFLATVEVDAAVTPASLKMGSYDHSVIDDFNRFITAGKRPNLGHRMLAHLTSPMRIQTILTTNFDGLIEAALAELSRPPRVLPIRRNEELPHPWTMLARPTVVKLHGQEIATRADASLDEQPSETDCLRFASLFLGRRFQREKLEARRRTHLFVVGCSVSDARTVALIKYLLRCSHDTKIFWICYDPWEEQQLCNAFFEDDYQERIWIRVSSRPALVLMELYQALTVSLPPGGGTISFTHGIPPVRLVPECSRLQTHPCSDPLFSDRNLTNPQKRKKIEDALQCRPCESIGGFRAALVRCLRNAIIRLVTEQAVEQQDGSVLRSLAPITSLKRDDRTSYRNAWTIKGVSNLMLQAGGQAFHDLSHRTPSYDCVWCEVVDVASHVDIIRYVLRRIAVSTGRQHFDHIVLAPRLEQNNPDAGVPGNPGDNAHVDSIADHVGNVLAYYGQMPERWVVFLFESGEVGSCAGWGPGGNSETQPDSAVNAARVLADAGMQVIHLEVTGMDKLLDYSLIDRSAPIC